MLKLIYDFSGLGSAQEKNQLNYAKTKTDSDEDEDAIETNKLYYFTLISTDSKTDEEDKKKCFDINNVLTITLIKENRF